METRRSVVPVYKVKIFNDIIKERTSTIGESMPIPQFQEFMKPALEALQNREIKHQSQIENYVANKMNISQEARREFLPNGRTLAVRSRLYWALYYMFRAGLVDRPKKASYQITEDGLKDLASGQRIDVNFLRKYPQFVDFLNKSRANAKDTMEDASSESDFDPDTNLGAAIEKANIDTKDDLLKRLRKVKDRAFEEICLELMRAMGYGVRHDLTKKSHDGGIDGIVYMDALGLDKIYLQEKRFGEGHKVNEKEVRDFIGALSTSTVTKGVFFTTSEFADKAKDAATQAQAKGLIVKLIDADKLVELMMEYNVGVQVTETYQRRKIDEDFFDEYE